MTKPFIIVQLRPEDDTSENEYQALLKYGGLEESETYRIRAEQHGLPELELDQFSGMIIGGSPFDITTPEVEKSDIQRQLEGQFKHLFDRVIAIDYPLLGACSGNGLLGAYLGTPMSRQYAEPVCCRNVTLTPAGKLDPLLAEFPEQIPVLLGHKEACDELPPGAELLIRGDECPIQMFRIKQNIYATQFHPEGDPEGFTLRVNAYKNHGYFKPEQAEQLISDLANKHTPESQLILKRFVERYRQG